MPIGDTWFSISEEVQLKYIHLIIIHIFNIIMLDYRSRITIAFIAPVFFLFIELTSFFLFETTLVLFWEFMDIDDMYVSVTDVQSRQDYFLCYISKLMTNSGKMNIINFMSKY